MTLDDWHQVQEADPVLSIIITRLREGTLEQDVSKKTDYPELGQYKREWNNLVLKKGVLYRWARPRGIRRDHPAVGSSCCTEGGCSERMPWWGWSFGPGVHAWSHAWQVLLASYGCTGKGAHREVSPMFSFQSQTAKSASQKHCGHSSSGAGPPWLSMPGTWERPRRNILVITDHFTRYAQAYVTRTQTSQMTVKTLWDKFIVHYGLPEKILTNQGQNFESQLVADLCELMGVQKIWTSPYHPQTNGQCERFNSTLFNMLGTSPKEKKSEWKNHIGTLVHAYNCTQNSAVGFSHYYLMFGRQPHLLVDVALGLAPCTITEPNTSKFIQKLRECTKWAHEKAEAFQAKEAQRHKWNYDKRSRAAAVEVGDMVLVHVTTSKGHHRMQDRWENREYVVEKQPYPNIPVYVVCPREGEECSWTLHRNYLLPINSNMGQGKADESEERVKNNTSLTPAPSADSILQDSPDWPAPVRCSTQTTRNQLAWRYWNFVLSTGTRPTSIWDAWVDLCVCLLILACLYIAFWRGAV